MLPRLLTCIKGTPVDKGLIKLAPMWGAPSISTQTFSHPVLSDHWPHSYVNSDVVEISVTILSSEIILEKLKIMDNERI